VVLAADDRLFGLETEQLAGDGCATTAPAAARPPGPVDGRKQGLKRSVAVEAGEIPLGVVAAAANRRDDGLLAATLDAITGVGPPPAQPVVHLDAGDDDQPCRQVLAERGMIGQIAARGVPAPIQAARRWPVERTLAWGTRMASSGWWTEVAGGWWRSGWRWQAPSSSAAGCCGVPGAATAGRPDPHAAPEPPIRARLADRLPGDLHPPAVRVQAFERDVARLLPALQDRHPVGLHPGEQLAHGAGVGQPEPDMQEVGLLGRLARVQARLKPSGLRRITVPSG
jgi:hypothetical protein